MPNCSSWQHNLNGKPALFIVEASSPGLTVKADPSMGIRAAALGQIELDNVAVPLGNPLGEDDATDQDYSEAIALSRLGWAALAVGTSHAVLDYVIPYIKERQAFGELIAHRQSVAFMIRQHRHRTRWPAADHLARRRSRRAGLPFAREAALARKLGTDKGMQIGLTACNCWAATVTPRNTRSSAGTATCGPSASPKASLS